MSKTLKIALGVNYIILGLLVLFNQNLPALAVFPDWARLSMPILLIIYGVFRLYRVFRTAEGETAE